MTSLVFVPERLCLSCIQIGRIPVGDKPACPVPNRLVPDLTPGSLLGWRAHDKFPSTPIVHMAIGKLTRLQPPSETTGAGG